MAEEDSPQEEYLGERATPEIGDRRRPSTIRIPDHYWFVEAWYQLRPVLIMFVVHVCIFGLIIGAIQLGVWSMKSTSMDAETKGTLDRLHLYANYIVLAIFSLSFIIKSLFIVYEDLFGTDERGI